MAKTHGGTRNYATGTSTYNNRKSEYNSIMASGDYNKLLSHFYTGGGYIVTHNEHRSPGIGDNTRQIANALARKGYRIFLDSEVSSKLGVSTPDGRVEKSVMDIKTIAKTGKSTIKKAMESAAKQGATVVILGQNTKKMTRQYVENQINLFKEKSPQRARDKINTVIVVGENGHVHRHKIK